MMWQRVLWRKQPFPDNYVGKSFFRIRKKCPEVTLSEAILGVTSVTQEICSCFLLVSVFYGLSDKQLLANNVIGFITCLVITIYSLMMMLMNSQNTDHTTCISSFTNDVKLLTFTGILLWFLSPIIQTLTASVATDTVMACTALLLVLHLVLHPYGAKVAIENPVMAKNLGIFSSVCLASRLNNKDDVFSLVITAVALFALLPPFRNFCKTGFTKWADILLTTCTLMTTLYALWMYAANLIILITVLMILTNFIVPSLFVYMQVHRQNIYGPWDEAEIKDG